MSGHGTFETCRDVRGSSAIGGKRKCRGRPNSVENDPMRTSVARAEFSGYSITL